MQNKTKNKLWVLLILLVFSPTWSFGFEDCFNYKCVSTDMRQYNSLRETLNAFERNEDNFVLDKRWPTVNLKLTPEEEMARFGKTGLEVAQRAQLAFHFDGTDTRSCVFVTTESPKGVSKTKGWRVEKNPPMPREYLDPAYPEEKKSGLDWAKMLHWTYPPDIRGVSLLIASYNNKEKDHDTWVWNPSWRKVRRLTPANGGDFMGASYKTLSDCFLRRITDEVHQIIGETKAYVFYGLTYFDYIAIQHKYAPHSPEFDRFMRSTIQPRECWVVRAVSVKGGYCDYYHSRVWGADKEWDVPCIAEFYTKEGKLMSSHMYVYMRQTGCDGKIVVTWCGYGGDINFKERGFSRWSCPEWVGGYENPDEWFTLRELKRSVPTDNIPYMPVLPPKNLLPLDVIFPSKELQAAYQKKFPKRPMEYPGEVKF